MVDMRLVGVLCALFAQWYMGTISYVTVLLGASVAYIAFGGYHTIWLVYHTSKRDLTAAARYIRLRLLMRWASNCNYCIGDMFERMVAHSPNKVAIIWQDDKWTFQQVSEYSNKVAHYLASRGLKRGDCMALVMTNRPEYVATWLGASKLGVVTALINHNLRHRSLHHCIEVSRANTIICGHDMQDVMQELMPLLTDTPVLVSGCGKDEQHATLTLREAINLDAALPTQSVELPEQVGTVMFNDRLLYIYTSGTTGLPKAAIITHAKYLFFCGAVQFMAALEEKDVLYNPLPLYHTAGGMVGIGQVLVFGHTMVIRSKFSVSQYWPECVKYGCTVGQYVGEICRYLLNSPTQEAEKQHKVRMMFGNGVRPQIWEAFTSRFSMPLIAEVYGATESNANIINFEGVPGACGFISLLCPSAYPVTLIRVDEATGRPMRGPDGLCVVCKPGEPGEFIGKIRRKDPLRDFHGYANSDENEKKIVRDVFKKGDLAFLSGDILVYDELGYVFFKDRTGDTFRWRGENVSTAEVEGQVSLAADNADAVVFGVEVPGAEGKAGMAVLVCPPEKEGGSSPVPYPARPQFYASLSRELPSYALPLFVRLVTEIDSTGTFKLKKQELQQQGYNLPHLLHEQEEVDASLYFLDAKKGSYVPLTKGRLSEVLESRAGL